MKKLLDRKTLFEICSLRWIICAAFITTSCPLWSSQLSNNQNQKIFKVHEKLIQGMISKQGQDGGWQGPLESNISQDAAAVLLLNKICPRLVDQNSAKCQQLQKKLVLNIVSWKNQNLPYWSFRPKGDVPSFDDTYFALKALEKTGNTGLITGYHSSKKWLKKQGDEKELHIASRLLFAWPLGLDKPAARIALHTSLLRRSSPIKMGRTGALINSLFVPLVSKRYFETRSSREKSPINASWVNAPLDMDSSCLYKKIFLCNNKRIAQEALGWTYNRLNSSGLWYSFVHTLVGYLAFDQAFISGFIDEEFINTVSAKVFKGLEKYSRVNWDGYTFIQSIDASGWDTPGTILSLQVGPYFEGIRDKMFYSKAIKYSLDMQLMKTLPKWQGHKDGLKVPGGWSFAKDDPFYPEADTSALNLEFLYREYTQSSDNKYISKQALQKAISWGVYWLLKVQNNDGGFPAWDKGNSKLLSGAIDFYLKQSTGTNSTLSDLSQVDITGRVVRTLALLRGSEFDKNQIVSKSIKRSCKYFKKQLKKSKTGFLNGRWMVAYGYGTSQAIEGIIHGNCMDRNKIVNLLDRLANLQNTDGGWGEAYSSYSNGSYVLSRSTPNQTVFILEPFLSFSEVYDSKYESTIIRALSYTADHYSKEHHIIADRPFVETQLPGLWYANYGFISTYMAIKNMGRFLILSKK